MLVLRRKLGEVVHIGNDITVEVTEFCRDHVKLGITAPGEVPVHRSEVFEAIQRGEKKGNPCNE